MKFTRWLLALSSASLIATSALTAQAQPAKQYPLRDFFKNPEQSSFRISPDGKALGFMQPYETRMNIFVQPIDKVGTKEGIKRVTSETARDISGYFFKTAYQVLYA